LLQPREALDELPAEFEHAHEAPLESPPDEAGYQQDQQAQHGRAEQETKTTLELQRPDAEDEQHVDDDDTVPDATYAAPDTAHGSAFPAFHGIAFQPSIHGLTVLHDQDYQHGRDHESQSLDQQAVRPCTHTRQQRRFCAEITIDTDDAQAPYPDLAVMG